MNLISKNEMAESSQVCDLRLLLSIRHFVGFFINIRSPSFRFLSKIYGVFFVALVICCGLYSQTIGPFFVWNTCGECVAYLIISWLTEDKYIFKFYKRVLAIDTLPCAPEMFKKLSKILIGLMIALIFWRLINMVQFIAIDPNSFSGLHPIIPIGLMSIVRDAGLFNIIMIFSAIYVRIIIIRKTIEVKGFEKAPLKNYSARQYIHMYEIVTDSLNEIGFPLKFSIFTLLCFTMPRTLNHLANVIFTINEGLHYSIWLTLVVTLVYNYASLIGSVVILDLTHDELRKIKAIIFDKMFLESTGEREHSELQLFLNVMKEYPLQFTVWRVLPFTLRVSLNLVSYCIITVMAAMQIHTFFSAS